MAPLRRKAGRPRAEVNLRQLVALAKIHCTYAEIAAVLGVSADTLERHFAARIETGREQGKQSLRRAQFKAALAGDRTMLIWLGKQHLGQADESRIKIADLTALTDVELAALAAGKSPK